MNSELRDTYDRIAEDWHTDHTSDDWWLDGTDAFIALLPPGGSVLDVGCGSGTKIGYLIRHGLHVTGIDFSQKQIDLAKKDYPAATLTCMTMEDIDQLSETFDGVFAQASLLHIPKKNIGEMMKKMTGRLKPQGALYIAVKERREGEPEEEIRVEQDYGYPYERFFSYFTLPELASYMENQGLTVVWQKRDLLKKTVWLQIIGKK